MPFTLNRWSPVAACPRMSSPARGLSRNWPTDFHRRRLEQVFCYSTTRSWAMHESQSSNRKHRALAKSDCSVSRAGGQGVVSHGLRFVHHHAGTWNNTGAHGRPSFRTGRVRGASAVGRINHRASVAALAFRFETCAARAITALLNQIASYLSTARQNLLNTRNLARSVTKS